MEKLILTLKDLEMLNACSSQKGRFERFFPQGVEVSEAGMLQLLQAHDTEAEGKVYNEEKYENNRFQVTWRFLYLRAYTDLEYRKLLVHSYYTLIGSHEYYETFLKLFKLAEPEIISYILAKREEHKMSAKQRELYQKNLAEVKADTSLCIIDNAPLSYILYVNGTSYGFTGSSFADYLQQLHEGLGYTVRRDSSYKEEV